MISETARQIFEGYISYKSKFDSITSNAKMRFENKQWTELQIDVAERLYLHKNSVDLTVVQLIVLLQGEKIDLVFWHQVYEKFSNLIEGRYDTELAYTFFSSATRKVFPDYFQNISSNHIILKNKRVAGLFADFEDVDLQETVAEILKRIPLQLSYPLINEDKVLISNRLRSAIEHKGFHSFQGITISKSLFFRNKTAYIAGKIILTEDIIIPFLIALVNKEKGLQADAVITTSEELEVIFSFTRSYFCVDTTSPSGMVSFLQELMPQKRQAEIYNSLGFNKHGKTILFNEFQRTSSVYRRQ
jgi:isocitrate dehydrogenase kinase/phosphatase